jgi:asparagine synthetase B (glutamine-hydrolysing)
VHTRVCQEECRRRAVLDKEFMDVAMRINPQDKMINKEHPMEKMGSA